MFGVGCKMQGIILTLFADYKHLFSNGIFLFYRDLFTTGCMNAHRLVSTFCPFIAPISHGIILRTLACY